MKQQSNYALRLPKSLKTGIEKAAKSDGVSFNQFMVSAAAENCPRLRRRNISLRARRAET